MLITAHGGAMRTGRNSQLYFNTIHKYDIDVIEVDVRKRGDLLYIAHLKVLFANKQIPLKYVFDYALKHNLKVNCDLKDKGIVGDVIKLARDIGAEEHLIFTGNLMLSDIDKITIGDAYVNRAFFRPLVPCVEDAENIKTMLDNCGNKNIKGININYKYATDAFIERAHQIGLNLSIYTIDKPYELKRIMSYRPHNVTTNIVDKAIRYREELR